MFARIQFGILSHSLDLALRSVLSFGTTRVYGNDGRLELAKVENVIRDLRNHARTIISVSRTRLLLMLRAIISA